jgi:drug/metabolite transporter (DMT)-like permease
LGGLALIWGASYALIKISIAELSPAVLVASRVLLGWAALSVTLRLRGLTFTRDRRLWRSLGVLGVIGSIIPYGLITWGELHITSGLAAVLQATTPLFTVVLAPLWSDGERITARRLGGVAVGLAGVIVLMGVPGEGGQAGESAAMGLLGALAIVGASLAYAITALYARHAVRGVPPVVSAAGQMGAATLIMVPAAALIGPLPAHAPSAQVVAAVLFLGLAGTGAAYILYYWLIEHAGATRTATVTYLLPPTALLWGALFLREPVTVPTLVGLAFILTGVLLVTAQDRRPLARRA